MCDSCLEFVLK